MLPSSPPSGAVTFLFTDIAGSTTLWEKVPQAMGDALKRHDVLLRSVVESHGGRVFKSVGDGVYAVFSRPDDAVDAAISAQIALDREDWAGLDRFAVRMAVHTGTAELFEDDYHGLALSKTARILSIAFPGQVLVSSSGVQIAQDKRRFKDLGEYRLRGISEAERIYQVVHEGLRSDFPVAQDSKTSRTNLPSQLSSFIGRDEELAKVTSCLRRSRLVTLTGSGGAGKTRLGLEVAASCMQWFAEGVWLVELAPLAHAGAISSAIALALHVEEVAETAFIESIATRLQNRNILLVLDNCEHVLDAAADIVMRLLQACPGMHVLATSREALGLPGEISIRIPSLTLPREEEGTALGGLKRFDAINMFLDRAAAADPEFDLNNETAPLVVQVCRRLDGIPLALELAATRLRSLGLAELAARIDDRFRLLTGGPRSSVSRQRTLRALIDWSYDLLSEKERSLLRSLSVFAGGWSLEAAEAVGATEDISSGEVLDLLSNLVEKSLVICDRGGGYRMLETIRQYAADRLADHGETRETRFRHMAYFRDFLTEGDLRTMYGMPKDLRPDLNEALRRWQRRIQNLDNIRAALGWAMSEDRQSALVIFSRLQGFFERVGSIREGSNLSVRLLDETKDLGDKPERQILALIGASLAVRTNDLETVARLAAEAADMALRLTDEVGYGEALAVIGNLCLMRRDFDAMLDAFTKAREIGLKTGNRALEARACYGFMFRARELGELESMETHLEEAAALFREIHDVIWIAWTNSYRGSLAEERGHLAEAARIYGEVLEEFAEFGGNIGTTWHWECLGRVASASGFHERSAKLFGAAAKERRRMGWPVQETELARNAAARERSANAAPNEYQEWVEEGASMSVEEIQRIAHETAREIALQRPA